MNDSYFENYSTLGSYENNYSHHTVMPNELYSVINTLGITFKPKSIFDLGAANGFLLIDYVKKFKTIKIAEGIEINPKYAKEANTKNYGKVNIKVKQGDFLKTNWRIQYDLLIVNVLMYIQEKDINKFLLKLYNLCGINSFVVLCVYSLGDKSSNYTVNIKGDVEENFYKYVKTNRPFGWWFKVVSSYFDVVYSDTVNSRWMLLKRKDSFKLTSVNTFMPAYLKEDTINLRHKLQGLICPLYVNNNSFYFKDTTCRILVQNIKKYTPYFDVNSYIELFEICSNNIYGIHLLLLHPSKTYPMIHGFNVLKIKDYFIPYWCIFEYYESKIKYNANKYLKQFIERNLK